MRVEVDGTRCVSAGQCVLSAPGVFDQREEDGVSQVLDATPPEEVHDAVREAEDLCPAGAVTVLE
ncbi:ferredoxin [Streptomyces sp. NPDC093252]|uniref:ferredoxin n=1 Tax=Streptomyces sp. NPDC093252 TaxID=3154980 RepID=UPI00341A5623